MLRYTHFVCLSLVLNASLNAQNLVPNGSFEIHTLCPNTFGQLNLASPWFSPTGTSTDLFDSCSSVLGVPYHGLYAKDGWAFIGIHMFSDDNREYAQIKLNDTLKKDQCYYVEFFTLCENVSPQAVNNVGANFSTLSYTNYPSGPYISVPIHITNYGNPIIKDTSNWTKISGIYTATGGEKYLTIGNFRNNQNTNSYTLDPNSLSANSSFYYVDVVSVTGINPAGNLPWSYRDTTIIIGDSVYIGNSMGGTFNANWYTITNSFIKQAAGIYVKPVSTSSYIVQYTVCGVSRADTVKVTVSPDVGITKLNAFGNEIKIYPVPANDLLQVNFSSEELRKKIKKILIYTLFGELIMEQEIDSTKSLQLKTSEFPEGVYVLSLKDKTNSEINKRFVISH